MITREGSHHKTWRWLEEQDIRNRNYRNGRVAGPPHGTVGARAGNQEWPYILWAGGSRAVPGPAPGSHTRPCRRCTRFRRSTKTREGQEKPSADRNSLGEKQHNKTLRTTGSCRQYPLTPRERTGGARSTSRSPVHVTAGHGDTLIPVRAFFNPLGADPFCLVR
jgi:hypothetical protein